MNKVKIIGDIDSREERDKCFELTRNRIKGVLHEMELGGNYKISKKAALCPKCYCNDNE